MRKMNVILFCICIAALSYMTIRTAEALTVTYTDFVFGDGRFTRQDIGGGVERFVLILSGSATNVGGEQKRRTYKHILSSAQNAHFENDLKGFVQTNCASDALTVPDWAQ